MLLGNDKKFTTRQVALGLIFTLSLLLFVVIAHEVVFDNEDWFDSRVFTWLDNRRTDFSTRLFTGITFFGSGEFLVPANILLVLLFLRHKRKTDALHALLLIITSTLLMYVLKVIFKRHRPEPLFDTLTTYSFPSGHSFSSLVFACVLSWEIWFHKIRQSLKWIATSFLFIMALSIGLSRIVLHYHYASDVLAGFSMAIAFVLFYYWLQNKITTKKI